MRHFAPNKNHKKKKRRTVFEIRREERRLQPKVAKAKRLKAIADEIRITGKKISEKKQGLDRLNSIGENNAITQRTVPPTRKNLLRELALLKEKHEALSKDYNRESNS